MAVRGGFEPPIQSPIYTLSRRAPSTTRTSHHIQSVFSYTVWNGVNYTKICISNQGIYFLAKINLAYCPFPTQFVELGGTSPLATHSSWV